MIDKTKLQEIYNKGATLSDMKLIMKDLAQYIQDNKCASMCCEFANLTYVLLCEYGFKPTICFGVYDWTKSTETKPIVNKMNHAWIEIDNTILDVGITLQDGTVNNNAKQNLENMLIYNNPVLFEPKHRKICKPYLLTISDKFWFTGQGKFIATWLLDCADCLCPGSIHNIKNHDLITLANKYLPYNITKEYIKEKYCNDDVIMTAPMKMIPFILNNNKYILT